MAVETELCLGDGTVRNKATRENTVGLGIAVDADDASGSTTTRRGHGLPIAYKTNTKHVSYSKCTFTALEEKVSHNEPNYTTSNKTHSMTVQRSVRRSVGQEVRVQILGTVEPFWLLLPQAFTLSVNECIRCHLGGREDSSGKTPGRTLQLNRWSKTY